MSNGWVRRRMGWLSMLLLSVIVLSTASAASAAKDKVVVAFGSNIPTLDPHMHAARRFNVYLLYGFHYPAFYYRDLLYFSQL
jgi:hypothetical protein